MAQPEGTEGAICQGDDLGVECGIVNADGLDADLLKLAVAASLRALVAEERSEVVELDRQLAAVKVVLNDRTHNACGTFWAQGYRAVAAVCEGVHLLGDHIGGFTNTAREERGVFEDRKLDVLEAGEMSLMD